nr:putative reverse transcriptase domain-containing protein [Tanacetum cinerariifolium]
MRQRRWMELFCDYGCETKYHIGKANIVVDAWRRKVGVKPRRVRDIRRTIQAEISENIEKLIVTKLLEFSVGDHVMMKVSPWKRVVRFGKKGELAPRYIGPFEILKRIGPVAYRLRLLDELSIRNYLSGVKISSKPEIALIL